MPHAAGGIESTPFLRDGSPALRSLGSTTQPQPLHSLHSSMGWLPPGLQPQRARNTGSHVSPRALAARRKDLIASYAVDWAAALILVIVFAVLDGSGVSGFQRQFSLTDTSIQHSYAVKERVSFTLDLILVVVVPVIIIVAIAGGLRRSSTDVHNGLLGLLLAVSLTLVTTDVLKMLGGRPRPDFIDRCQPAPGSANQEPYGLSTAAICTRTDLLNDGFRSWPSGHSSSSFAGLGFLSFFLAGKLHLFDQRGQSLKSWVAFVPLLGAACIAMTRTMDYRHHATDVLTGGLIGFFLALWSYLLYYPSLRDQSCHLPYEPRFALDEYDSEGQRIQLSPRPSAKRMPGSELPLYHSAQQSDRLGDEESHLRPHSTVGEDETAPRPPPQ